MTNQEQNLNPKNVRQDIDFYKIFKVFFSRWYWILGCMIIALAIGRVNILYTVPVYQTSGQLKLQESNPTINSVASSTQVYNYTDKIQAEGFVIKSNEVIINAIANIDYKISYYLTGTIITSELYPNKPFDIEIVKQDSVDFSRNIYFVEYINKEKFALGLSDDRPKKEYRYGQPISMGNMVFKIKSQIPERGKYSFKFNGKDDFIGRAIGRLNTMEAAKYTNVMLLSLTDENPAFAADMLNAIMKEYVAHDVVQKRRSARQTIEFIDSQLGFLTTKADSAGKNFADYKAKNKITDITSANQMNLGKLNNYEEQKVTLGKEMIGINQLEQQVENNRDKLEVNLDLEGDIGGLLGGLISQFNNLISVRQLKLRDFKIGSQPINDIDKQIADVKQAIKSNIRSLKDRNIKLMRYTENQMNLAGQKLSQSPQKEMAYGQFESNFEINSKVKNFLSEKKLESEMNAAAIVPGAAIVNFAYKSDTPISSKPVKIYTFAMMLGFAFGIGIILLVRFLNPFIYDKETVESLTSTPIIGVIRKFPEFIDKDSRQALSLAKPKSVFAESVRSVRTNLSFLAANKKSKTICITSEISGEGKSFVTVNLAGTLALIDKKIILIAADLRKSKLHKVFGSDNKKGLSSYLSGTHTLEQVMIHDSVHNIDFIPSGPVPPNPSELLHTENMKELLAILTPKYDYVLIDTAPVGLVSDAIPLIRQSDVNLFVIRSGKSQFRAAAIPERLSREYGLSNLAIVLNAFGDDALHSNYYTTDYSRGGGNSTYYYSDYSGYAGAGYYDNDPKKWWEFWKKK
jgi:tyrosine-protein kinase Etk/Wzc